jgi:hypothetical protein
MDGNIDEALASVADLYFVNTVVSSILETGARRVMGMEGPKPRLSRKTPEFYRAVFDALTTLKASPRAANEAITLVENVFPPALSNFGESLSPNRTKEDRVNSALGIRTIEYDPVKTVSSEYLNNVKRPTDAAMSQVRTYLQFGQELREGALEEMYVDAIANEYEGFVEARKAAEGAFVSGASRSSLMDALKSSGVSAEDATNFLNGRFVPSSFSDQFLGSIERNLINDADGFQEKQKVKRNLLVLKQQLRQLSVKHRNFLAQE